MEEIRHITSRDNPSVKHAKSVREGREKGLIFIEGVRLVEEALRSGLTIREAFVSIDRLDSGKVGAVTGELKRKGSTIHAVPAKIADSLSDTKSGQGLVAIGEQPTAKQLSDLTIDGTASIPLILFLEEINNPSNLGAVIRTAEAVGVVGVITSIRSADPYSPKALRASMGSAFRLPIVTDVDINSLSDWARLSGLTVTAADVSAATSHFDTDWRKGRVLVFGSEAHGLNADVISSMDELTLIDMDNGVESLNLAVACGIILFEARRQNLSS